MRSTGMLTNPKVIVPDHIERTGAPTVSIVSCAPPLRFCLGNLLLLHGGDAGAQALCETRGRRLLRASDGLQLLAACFSLDQLVQTFAILVLPRRGLEIRFDGRHELLCEFQFAGCRL